MSNSLKISCHFTIFPFPDNNILVSFENHKICTFAVYRGTSVLLRVSRGVPRNFVRGGVQEIQLRTEDRENVDLEVAAH